MIGAFNSIKHGLEEVIGYSECKHIKRREFLKFMAFLSATTAFPFKNALGSLDIKPGGSETGVSLAGVEKGSGDSVLIQAVKNAARSATDFSWLSRGDSVLIKPAVNSGNAYPATTNPESVRAVVELLKEKGAGRIVVSDMSGIEHVKLTPEKLRGSTRELMKQSGISKAAVEAGAELFFPEEKGWDAFFEDEPQNSKYWKNSIMMPSILKEVDHLVLMPRCSRHLLLGSSLGLKNAVGYWRTDSRLEYHKYASTIQEKTADANTVKSLREKQRLVLSTATKVRTCFGPDKGFVCEPETGLVIASESIVAHDMVSLAWLLKNRSDMSPEDREHASDPYQNQMKVSLANHVVVKFLGDIGDVINSEKLVRNDLNSIWDDRVLTRAYEVFGGIPQLKLKDVEHSVQSGLEKELNRMVTKPIFEEKA